MVVFPGFLEYLQQIGIVLLMDDEVDESQYDNQHGNTQQGIGRDDRPLPAGRL